MTLTARAEDDLAVLKGGYDGAPQPEDHRKQAPWKVGRWWRAQGGTLPTRLRRAEDGLMVVDGQVLTIDAGGQVRNLSASHRR